jgi:hypothetical protein
MNDAQRYRMNAAECLSAVERCAPPYRGLTLAIAASWVSLARQHFVLPRPFPRGPACSRRGFLFWHVQSCTDPASSVGEGPS